MKYIIMINHKWVNDWSKLIMIDIQFLHVPSKMMMIQPIQPILLAVLAAPRNHVLNSLAHIREKCTCPGRKPRHVKRGQRKYITIGNPQKKIVKSCITSILVWFAFLFLELAIDVNINENTHTHISITFLSDECQIGPIIGDFDQVLM